MRLSDNFWLSEFTRSQTASRKGIDNIPDQEAIDNLQNLCYNCLQKIRDHFGKAIRISSGYRSPELNVAIGGSKTSSHCRGEAADFEIYGISNFKLAEWCMNNLEFDQLILEYPGDDLNDGWIHISYKSAKHNRNQVLTATRENSKTVYKKGLIID